MRPRSTIALSSIGFATLWTAYMLWWSAPLDVVKITILVVGGGISGLLWYWVYGKWYLRYFGRRNRST
jgi:hypothetical protein